MKRQPISATQLRSRVEKALIFRNSTMSDAGRFPSAISKPERRTARQAIFCRSTSMKTVFRARSGSITAILFSLGKCLVLSFLASPPVQIDRCCDRVSAVARHDDLAAGTVSWALEGHEGAGSHLRESGLLRHRRAQPPQGTQRADLDYGARDCGRAGPVGE